MVLWHSFLLLFCLNPVQIGNDNITGYQLIWLVLPKLYATCFKSASCVGAGYGHFGYCQPSHGPSSLKLWWAVGEAVGRCSDDVACWNLQAERPVLALSLRTINKIDLRQKTQLYSGGKHEMFGVDWCNFIRIWQSLRMMPCEWRLVCPTELEILGKRSVFASVLSIPAQSAPALPAYAP